MPSSTALADAVLQTDVGVLSDEIYEQLTYGDARPTCFATLRPGLADRTITISGVSKTYAMTGWRIGWAVAAEPVAKFMGDLQSQETSNPCSVSQWAALEAVTGPQDSVALMKAEFQKRRDLCARAHRVAAGRDLPSARRCLLCVHEYLGPTSAERWAASRSPIRPRSAWPPSAKLSVALVMGSAFGAEGYARLSFATSMRTLERGFDALAHLVQG